MSQNKQILRYLQTHKRGITPIDALNKFGCFRLSARIADLRGLGWDIRTDLEPNVNNEGRHARYFLMEGKA